MAHDHLHPERQKQRCLVAVSLQPKGLGTGLLTLRPRLSASLVREGSRRAVDLALDLARAAGSRPAPFQHHGPELQGHTEPIPGRDRGR